MINLAFATGDFETKNYKTRLMYLDANRNPLHPSNWILTEQPFLQSSSSNQVYAP